MYTLLLITISGISQLNDELHFYFVIGIFFLLDNNERWQMGRY